MEGRGINVIVLGLVYLKYSRTLAYGQGYYILSYIIIVLMLKELEKYLWNLEHGLLKLTSVILFNLYLPKRVFHDQEEMSISCSH